MELLIGLAEEDPVYDLLHKKVDRNHNAIGALKRILMIVKGDDEFDDNDGCYYPGERKFFLTEDVFKDIESFLFDVMNSFISLANDDSVSIFLHKKAMRNSSAIDSIKQILKFGREGIEEIYFEE